jgi:hypothetical protein
MDDALIAAQIEVTVTAINELRDEVKRERRTLERKLVTAKQAFIVAVSAAILGSIVSLWLVWNVKLQADQIVRDRTAGRVAACERDNGVRADILSGFDSFITQLAATGQQPTDDTAKRAREELVATFRARFAQSLPNLAPRNCDPAELNKASTAR